MKRLMNAFGFAFSGLKTVLLEGRNFQIQLGVFVVVLVAAFWLQCSPIEWMFLLMASGIVFVAEMLNSALELLCDHVTPDKHFAIKRVKDIAAGAALVASLFAVVVGLIVFIPKLV